nr:MAG TPA: PROTEIN/RNA Complex cruzi, ribosomal subunit, assmebly [Caudoviricetes sp.]
MENIHIHQLDITLSKDIAALAANDSRITYIFKGDTIAIFNSDRVKQGNNVNVSTIPEGIFICSIPQNDHVHYVNDKTYRVILKTTQYTTDNFVKSPDVVNFVVKALNEALL